MGNLGLRQVTLVGHDIAGMVVYLLLGRYLPRAARHTESAGERIADEAYSWLASCAPRLSIALGRRTGGAFAPPRIAIPFHPSRPGVDGCLQPGKHRPGACRPDRRNPALRPRATRRSRDQICRLLRHDVLRCVRVGGHHREFCRGTRFREGVRRAPNDRGAIPTLVRGYRPSQTTGPGHPVPRRIRNCATRLHPLTAQGNASGAADEQAGRWVNGPPRGCQRHERVTCRSRCEGGDAFSLLDSPRIE